MLSVSEGAWSTTGSFSEVAVDGLMSWKGEGFLFKEAD
jgi:hypothetical protein